MRNQTKKVERQLKRREYCAQEQQQAEETAEPEASMQVIEADH